MADDKLDPMASNFDQQKVTWQKQESKYPPWN